MTSSALPSNRPPAEFGRLLQPSGGLSTGDFQPYADSLALVGVTTDATFIARSVTDPEDPTPDLLALSPNGSHAFMSLRGPNPLTADPHVSTGSSPGVGVVKVLEDGRSGRFESVAAVSNVDAGSIERADVHALALRVIR